VWQESRPNIQFLQNKLKIVPSLLTPQGVAADVRRRRFYENVRLLTSAATRFHREDLSRLAAENSRFFA
jgi:hypothetical protein